MKSCKKCGENKPLEGFYPHPQTKDGRRSTCKTCENVQARAWHAANPDRRKIIKRRYWLKIHYGITPEQYDEILAAQDGRCACCETRTPGGTGGFAVDHCHTTGKIRGLLCSNCNAGIGKLGDGVEGVARALAYLQRSEAH